MIHKSITDNLEKLIEFSNEECVCKGEGTCISCMATVELENIAYQLDESIKYITESEES